MHIQAKGRPNMGLLVNKFLFFPLPLRAQILDRRQRLE